MNKLLSSFILISTGLVAGYSGHSFFQEQLKTAGLISSESEQSGDSKGEKEILYWVAPMDANYRRDKPGKSPMGMDLVPVYKEDDSGVEGVVKISPVVQNNLGVGADPLKRHKNNKLGFDLI